MNMMKTSLTIFPSVLEIVRELYEWEIEGGVCTIERCPERNQDRPLMTHKCRGSIVVLSISKSVEPNEEQKEMISGFQ